MQYYSQNLLGDSYFVYNGNVLRLVQVSCVNHCWHEWETLRKKKTTDRVDEITQGWEHTLVRTCSSFK